MSTEVSTIAQHYNQLGQSDVEKRKQSPIYYLRSFNNWTKSVLINEALDILRKDNRGRRIRVLDFCCGKGGDLQKWIIGNVNYVVFADIAEVSVQQAENRYRDRRRNRRIFEAEFIVADLCHDKLSPKLRNPSQMFDLVSCQFSFHYSFETYERAERMLRNACDRLAPGGLFIGTIPDAHEIMRRLHSSPAETFGNDIYRVKFNSKDPAPLFGAKYHFYLQEHVDCPEFLVFFPVLMKMAEKLGMTLLVRSTFSEFFEEHRQNQKYKELMHRMQALEKYSHTPDSEEEYSHAEAEIDRLVQLGISNPVVGTLSKSQWEVASMYSVFIFQKAE
ncbi:hypothetical protein RvY_05540-2 [Ramazzottius varieornatus]|uniref:mRNA (guanine-N(7))-methyltransferase n=1 Tax=Ramazzottius varieornatus TaxID=947166 RepID=A0A1D1UVE7_RAMVA|nr:hypothetical protein RvY_05540-2 [Ramazzottius varieornatus]